MDVKNLFNLYTITPPNREACKQVILSGIYGATEGLCLGVSPIALGAIKAIDMLFNEMTTTQTFEVALYIKSNPWPKRAVQVISFAACAGALYAGGFALPTSRIAVSVGLLVLRTIFADKIAKLAEKDGQVIVDVLIDAPMKGFTISTLIGADPLLMISAQLFSCLFEQIFGRCDVTQLEKNEHNLKGPSVMPLRISKFSSREQHLFSTATLATAALVGAYEMPFLVHSTPMKVATAAAMLLLTLKLVVHETPYARPLRPYV